MFVVSVRLSIKQLMTLGHEQDLFRETFNKVALDFMSEHCKQDARRYTTPALMRRKIQHRKKQEECDKLLAQR